MINEKLKTPEESRVFAGGETIIINPIMSHTVLETSDILTVTKPDHINQAHWDEFVKGSGISPELAAINFQSINASEFKKISGARLDCNDGWMITSYDNPSYIVYKPDGGWIDSNGDKHKYKVPKSANVKSQPLLPRYFADNEDNSRYWDEVRTNNDQPIAIIESMGKKLFASYQAKGIPAIGINGVWGWMEKGKGIHPSIATLIGGGRKVYFIPDADVATNQNVRKAVLSFIDQASKLNGYVVIPEMPMSDLDTAPCKAIDDLMAQRGIVAVKAMLENALGVDAWKNKYTLSQAKSVILTDLLKKHFKDSLRYNIRQNIIELGNRPFDDFSVEWMRTSNDLACDIPREQFEAIIKMLARDQQYDPVKEVLDNIPTATEIKILPTLAKKLFGDVTSEFESQLFIKWLISTVARVYDPGCKADGALVLQGAQGYRKTSLFAALAMKDDFFLTLQEVPQKKDDLLKMAQAWIIELGEIEHAFSKASIEGIKDCLSSRQDSIRRPYASQTEILPRRCIFSGSANTDQFLNDPTGNRRFWVIPVAQEIPLDWLKNNIRQVWGEVKFLYENGCEWWLSKDDEAMLTQLNQRFESNSSVDDNTALSLSKISNFIQRDPRYQTVQLCFTISQIALIAGLKRSDTEMNRKTEMAVAKVLKKSGWIAIQRSIQGSRIRVWHRAIDESKHHPELCTEDILTRLMGSTSDNLLFDEIDTQETIDINLENRQLNEYSVVLDNAFDEQSIYQALDAMIKDGWKEDAYLTVMATLENKQQSKVSDVARRFEFFKG